MEEKITDMEETITEENMAENVKNFCVKLWKDRFVLLIIAVLLCLVFFIVKACAENDPRFGLHYLAVVYGLGTTGLLVLVIYFIRKKEPLNVIIYLFLFLMCCGFCYLLYDGYSELE